MSSGLLDDQLPARAEPGPAASQNGPVTKLIAGVVQGRHTDLVVTRYSDKLFLAVTQLGKLGTLLEVRRDRVEVTGEAARGGRAVFSCSVLLGQDTEEVHLLARMLAERLELSQPLVLSVGVKGLTVDLAKLMVDFIVKNLN